MTLQVATALSDAALESRVVQLVATSADAVLVRRCRDVVELRAVVQTDQVDVVVIDGGLRGVDRDVVDALLAHDIRLVVVSESTEDWLAVGAHDVVGRDLVGLADSLNRRSRLEVVVPTGDRAEPVGRLVAIWGPAGAPGRSTVAVELASSLMRQGEDVLLIDLDTLGPSLAQQVGLIDDTSGVAAAVRSAAQGVLEPDVLAGLAVTVPGGVRVLVGLPSHDRWRELRPASTEAVLQCSRATAAWTVVDVGSAIEGDDLDWLDPGEPQRFGAARTALSNADVVVCVGRTDPVGLTRLLKETPKAKSIAPTAMLRILLNRTPARGEGREAQALVRDVLGMQAAAVPDDPKNVGGALRRGCPVAEVSSRSPFVLGIDDLADDLRKAIGSYDRSGEPAARSDRRLLRGAHRRH